MVPVEHLQATFRLCKTTGALFYRGQKHRRRAGYVREDGYRVVKVRFGGRRIQMMAHRIVWALHRGEHPELEVDHKDGNRRNNRPGNLRLANRVQQIANRKTPGKWPKGVRHIKGAQTKPFAAAIRIEGKKTHLGTFECPTEAHEVYMAKAVELYGEFARA